MQEKERLSELFEYKILDTPPEENFDELARIASAVCNTPMSLVTFIDSERQWYKAKWGVDMNEVPRLDSFCQFALENPYEVLVVDDPLSDARFKDNRYVTGAPHIRFYAGAPLTSSNGHVLGTLCVMDSRYHNFSDTQKNALQLLAKKAMELVDMRKIILEQGDRIEHNADKLKKLTDLVPGVIFQLETTADGSLCFSFLSEGIQNIHPGLTFEELNNQPQRFYDFIHEDDRERVERSILQSLVTEGPWNEEFRMEPNDTEERWYWGNGRAERGEDGTLVLYGTLHDITARKKYEEVLDQILHDVSHVMRRPISSMLGLVSLMEKDVLDEQQLKEYMLHVKKVFAELDTFTRNLNKVYNEKRAQQSGE